MGAVSLSRGSHFLQRNWVEISYSGAVSKKSEIYFHKILVA